MSEAHRERPLAPAPAAVLVHLSGDLDLATAPDAQEMLLQAGGGGATVVADLSGVAFLDCCGLGALVQARTALGGRLALHDPSAVVVRLLELTELGDTFVIVDARA